MLAPHIKKKVDELWNRFWAAGLTNPLVAVEQITYLLFLKRLEDIDLKRQQRGFSSIYVGYESCKWSYIRQEKTNPGHLIDVVFPWLRELDKHFSSASANGTELSSLNNRMADAYFQLDPNKGKVLSDAIDAIDQLFARAGEGSAAQDIMGDTFEYLLSEVATAGKNGQFRTPRHLIRFMVELLDPEPGQSVIDPAAGTGGFLFSTQQYLMRKFSAQDNLVLEWDGTPHRTDGAAATPEQYDAIHNGAYFVGLDNDRTMARIGWMNLVLHDVIDPHLLQGDSLSKREGKAKLKELLEPGSYQFVLANPPFTGTVDSGDLEPDTVLFPRVGGGGKKKDESITNKSELLFLWLMLDLLDIGGRCAVIIPEGVLFGNTDAHVRLRRELLVEHMVEGVISLPGGVFQPYTGVKTSILIFRKVTRRDNKQSLPSNAVPLTEHVWFYEVEEDGYSKDAKRNPRPGQQNDLWDALIKFKAWIEHGRSGAQSHEKTLLQPSFHTERWRQALLRDTADKLTPAGEAFSALPDTSMWDGQVWGIHELFPELPADPKEAEDLVRNEASRTLYDLVIQFFAAPTQPVWIKWKDKPTAAKQMDSDKALAEWKRAIKVPQQEFNRAVRDVQRFFEAEDGSALLLWKDMVKDALKAGLSYHQQAVMQASTVQLSTYEPVADLNAALEGIAREVAKLDGFDVTLRSLAIDQATELKAAKHWVVPVRAWARNDEWKSADGKVVGSHNAEGLVRPSYVEAMLADGLYTEKGVLKDGLLDSDCIEAREWNLSAGQYKPFDFTQLKSDKSLAELIGSLKTTEQDIIKGLDKLLAMVEGRE
ncbi:TPA: SAM-dependent DNA methyltransferase [Klebsiella aerogenes]|uniref:type I restriction-modification system subunit M n=1 Tax=Enterobacteriaceae TaxID=543 RepID=UPI000667E845|nr:MULTISPECIES: class I SAM-dependent DNA methyltransferase [Enterobacteriaceae]EKW2925190.1 SAM-dependent DNA methyltransferase [Citrobacter amalonaticus]HDH0785344.1 SAM-dependent DNA methyltransferase [Klebsiella oxytoca]MBQ4926350.1 SAM-dependent DNA methyltransferase [Citrobacter werkmanii]MBQ4938650.1 SAM-dependent DNA methyltransferase [Citrobacter werkmanii]MBQ4951496.1 SAM-dependent DNA methyltransferase [Citrobacter werkmanii]